MKGKYLLYGQLILLIFLFYFTNLSLIFKNGFLAILFIFAMGLGLYSIYNMGLDTFSPFPEPKKGSKHIQTGAYKFIRHPMYTSIMILGLMLVLSNPQFLNTIIYIILLYILDAKATYEERFLLKLHPTYKEYTQKTSKFLPFVY
jgi:protein-S-isoprenylcysteine O-methyltransferase Ste14